MDGNGTQGQMVAVYHGTRDWQLSQSLGGLLRVHCFPPLPRRPYYQGVCLLLL